MEASSSSSTDALVYSAAAEIPSGLTLVTGPRGAGKTSWCAALAALAGDLRLSVAGVLCPARVADELKTGIDLVDLRTGECRSLGSRAATSATGLLVGCWQFDAETLGWGNTILEQSGNADLVIIDELGPLEFKQGGGFQAGLRLVDEGRYRSAWVVIRPALVALACARWPSARVIAIGGDSR